MARHSLIAGVAAVVLLAASCSGGGTKHAGQGAAPVIPLGPCPTETPYSTANPGVEGLAERFVPLKAMLSRIFLYGSGLLDTIRNFTIDAVCAAICVPCTIIDR